MKKQVLAVAGCLVLNLGIAAQATNGGPAANGLNSQMLREQKHFVECLASVYSPAWWFSYNGALYFQPRNETQAQHLEAMKAARSQYVALTNQETRHALAARLIAACGIGETWQKKLLLPFSTTNQNFTPTLNRPLRVVPAYKVLRCDTNGDALIQDNQSTMFVMNFGRGASDGSGTNALLVREGLKTFSSGGVFETVNAYENVSLNKEETTVLERVAAACRNLVTSLSQPPADSAAKAEFEARKARATDSNPYMQYLLAKAYLEGKGTGKDEKLGMEWMRRAASSGSGDAIAFLKALEHRAP
ncbi:MAG TPA: SEL1-like repeat protein [Candidatus Paceibacterota bacterium]|nr:SEL1-like repeat protein [Verrucomicrobiota bacterium]HSA10095.1 SEL1-like repeat protein [Candidatus Paceibacterota bacterium]